MHQASPYVLSEQSHVVQHPPPKDALTPAQLKALEGDHAKDEEDTISIQPVEKMPAYFISHGDPSIMFEPESLPYKSLQALGDEIKQHKPKAIIVASSHWLGDDLVVYVNNGEENPLICMFINSYLRIFSDSKDFLPPRRLLWFPGRVLQADIRKQSRSSPCRSYVEVIQRA